MHSSYVSQERPQRGGRGRPGRDTHRSEAPALHGSGIATQAYIPKAAMLYHHTQGCHAA